MLTNYYLIALLASAASCPAMAADTLAFGPPPAWVVQVPSPTNVPSAADASPVTVLLNDQQALLEPAKSVSFTNIAIRIDTPQGLAAGNISLPWDPSRQSLTVNRLIIRRGDQLIDVLKSGQTFTTLRRETNLDAATLDGVLTANIQPEGLQVGDVVEIAVTQEYHDPVMKGHVEAILAQFNGSTTKRGHLRVQWPAALAMKMRASSGLPPIKPVKNNGRSIIEFTMDGIDPIIVPKGAPARFRTGRALELTDFASWSDLASLMMDHYRTAAVIPPTGPLREELKKIRAGSSEPSKRAEAALALVQDRVRYVALTMGQGGYVPAPAELTWSRRFGDCKAKTVLLLGMLHELGIEAVPVVVDASGGDGIDQRLPSIALFNHVLVMATIGGKDYWLDGTRTGDTSLGRLQVPAFGWGLPLVQNASLVRMIPSIPARPTNETEIRVDAREGISLPSATHVESILRGDEAAAVNAVLAGSSQAQRDQLIRTFFKQIYADVEPKTTTATYDKATGDLKMTLEGTTQLDWDDGWYFLTVSRLAYQPDFDRTGGSNPEAPFATSFPSYSRAKQTILLPSGFSIGSASIADINEVVAGIEYRRKAGFDKDVFTVETSERTIVPEISYKEAIAAAPRLRELADDTISIRTPDGYRPREKEVAALLAEQPATAKELLKRGSTLLDLARFDEALGDFDAALAKDPANAVALADRGLAHIWKSQPDLARRDLDAAHKIKPGLAVVARARGLLAQTTGD